MRFQAKKTSEPEINLIPFIDVLLVVLIFLMLSTTYSKITELELTLPSAHANPVKAQPNPIVISITASDKLYLQGVALDPLNTQQLVQKLGALTQGVDNPVVVISADAQATHQSVMRALEAAQHSGVQQISFATQADRAADK